MPCHVLESKIGLVSLANMVNIYDLRHFRLTSHINLAHPNVSKMLLEAASNPSESHCFTVDHPPLQKRTSKSFLPSSLRTSSQWRSSKAPLTPLSATFRVSHRRLSLGTKTRLTLITLQTLSSQKSMARAV